MALTRRQWQDLAMALTIVCAVAFVVLFDVGYRPIRNWWCARDDLTSCKSNLKNIGTAMEMYSTDDGRCFPPTLAHLTPRYLKVIPTCPAAGCETYVMKSYNG